MEEQLLEEHSKRSSADLQQYTPAEIRGQTKHQSWKQ
jgi:hypothetical protein